MTCIVGVEHRGQVWIGGDSAGTDDNGGQYILIEPAKVFRIGDLVLGVSGSLRMAQVIRHGLQLPNRDASRSDEAWLSVEFMTAVRGFLQTSGLMIRTSRGTDELDGAMLIGYRGNLYTADPDCSVSRSRFGWDAIGCGGRYARGALAAMTETDPLRRVRRTLEVACALNANCRPPFVVLSDPPRKVKR